MKSAFSFAIYCVVCVALSLAMMAHEVRAQTKSKIKARRALVGVDGSAVYKAPSFDSEILTYLSLGEKVISSIQTFQGAGGIGLFFKVKTSKGVLGFVVDTDLFSEKSKRPLSPLAKGNKDMDPPAWGESQQKEDEAEEQESIYFTRYLGATIGKKVHRIKHQSKTLSSDLLFFGVRGSGPGTLFDGPPLDFNLLVSIDSPEYYKSFAQNEPNGFVVFSDFLLQLPFWENQRHMFSYTLGLMALYSSYTVKEGGKASNSKEFRFGPELGLGYSYLIKKKYIIRLDYKYQWERFQTTSYMLSFQKEYR